MVKETVTQENYVPTRKVGMGQAAGSVVTIAAYVLEEYMALQLPLFVATAFLQLVMFGIQYYVKDAA